MYSIIYVSNPFMIKNLTMTKSSHILFLSQFNFKLLKLIANTVEIVFIRQTRHEGQLSILGHILSEWANPSDMDFHIKHLRLLLLEIEPSSWRQSFRYIRTIIIWAKKVFLNLNRFRTRCLSSYEGCERRSVKQPENT